MAEAIPGAVEMAAKPMVNCITTHLDYIRRYESNLANLKRQLQNLKGIRETKKRQIDEAKKNIHGIEPVAENWLERADQMIDEAEEIIKEDRLLNMKCFNNPCPNLKKRYQQSKKAAKMMKAVSELHDQAKDIDSVWYHTVPAEHWLPDDYENIESRQSDLGRILDALRTDDVNVVGVYGIGGSGKTMLVKEVGKKCEEDRLFDKVVFVEVSNSDTEDIRKIQTEIAEKLGFIFSETSKSAIANLLRCRIKLESKILLILDDIWKHLNLEEVGIPFGNDHMGCKLLLTSRDEDLLKNMGSEPNFVVETLQEEEACNLFMKIAGVREKPRDLQELALAVAKQCRGLLVAIITIAKALRNKPENEWKIALRDLRNPPSIEEVDDSVVKKAYISIYLSYIRLESETLKSIFLHCSVMGSTRAVFVEELLNYAVGLSLFKENTVEYVRDKSKKVSSKTQGRFLVT